MTGMGVIAFSMGPVAGLLIAAFLWYPARD